MFTKEDVFDIFTRINMKETNYTALINCKETDIDDEEFFYQCMNELANDAAVEEMNKDMIRGLPVVSIEAEEYCGAIGAVVNEACREHFYVLDAYITSMLFITDKKVKKIGYEETGMGSAGPFLYTSNIVSYVSEDREIIITEEVNYYANTEELPLVMVIRQKYNDENYSPLLNCMEDYFDEFYKELWDT